MGIISNIFNFVGSGVGVVVNPTPTAGAHFVGAAADLVPSNQTVGRAVARTVHTVADLNNSIDSAAGAGMQIITTSVHAINRTLKNTKLFFKRVLQ